MREELKLEENLTLDEIARLALDKQLHRKDSSIRDYEKCIADVIQNQTENMETDAGLAETENITEDIIGKILDIADEMNHKCFKAGMQEGAQLVLELLQTT